MSRWTNRARVAVLAVLLSACAEDVVPSAYPIGGSGTGGAASGAGGVGGSAGVMAGAGGTAGVMAGVGGAGAMGGTGAIGGTGAVGGTGAMGGTGAVGGMEMTGGSGGMGGGEPSGPCDISGRWLYTSHIVTDAFSAQQTAHVYNYYEISKDGDGYALTKTLRCGNDAVGLTPVKVFVDMRASWEEVRKRASDVGRTVTSTESAGGCDVHFGRWVNVSGATVPHYLNESVALPTAEQEGNGTNPGWEDWDGDGEPGITGILTYDVPGRIFTAPRIHTEMQGTVPDMMTKIRLPVIWNQEQNVMSWDPPDNFTLALPSDVAADPSLHFAEFARLAADQAVGDDAAICTAILELAPTLTPEAAAPFKSDLD